MPETVGPLVDQLLRRIDDPTALGTSRDLTRRLLAYAEGHVALSGGLNLEDFTLTTEAARLVYSPRDVNERIVKVRTVLVNGKELPVTSLAALASEPSWFRHQSASFLTWAPVGLDLIVLYPGTPAAESVTLRCVAFTAAYTDSILGDGDSTTLEFNRTDDFLRLAEALLCLRTRRLDRLSELLDGLVKGADK